MSETLTNGVIVPDKGSRDWYADLRSNWLKLDSLIAGGNITINPAQTEGILVATITVGGKEYKLYQQDGDVSVKIDPSAENAEYPLVASTSTEANTGSVVMAPAVTVNPSMGVVTATSFKGKLEGNASTATTATKAVQDGTGAVITDTYATKKELGSKAEDANVVHKSGTEIIVGTKTFSSNIVGNLTGNADTATKATQDASGNVITDTYATKTELNSKANDSSVVHTSGNETINGLKTFSYWQVINLGLNVKWITGNKEQKSLHLFGSVNDAWEGFGSKLELHGDDANYGMFSLVAKDKTNTNVKRFIGKPDGTLIWDSAKILLERDRIALCKNLTGANIAVGGVVDCGNGNGKLKQWYLNADGTFVLANTLPTGVWKSSSFITLGPNEGGIFIKIG